MNEFDRKMLKQVTKTLKAVQEFEGDYIYKDGFIDGIKYAEKAHGIEE